jgi:hypothetical protein
MRFGGGPCHDPRRPPRPGTYVSCKGAGHNAGEFSPPGATVHLLRQMQVMREAGQRLPLLIDVAYNRQ